MRRIECGIFQFLPCNFFVIGTDALPRRRATPPLIKLTFMYLQTKIRHQHADPSSACAWVVLSHYAVFKTALKLLVFWPFDLLRYA